MVSKNLKVLLGTFFLVIFVNQANASFVPYFQTGHTYTDVDGKFWEFVGSFDVGDGPQFLDVDSNGIEDLGDSFPTPFNALQAAEFLGFGSIGDLAISAFEFDVGGGDISVDEFTGVESAFGVDIVEVNYSAWYDGFNGPAQIRGEGIEADKDNDGKYTAGQDRSAYVKDRTADGDHTNYVFKSIQVPEPSTFAIFVLAISGLGFRFLRK